MKRIARSALLVLLLFGLAVRAAYAVPTALQLTDGAGDWVWVSDSAATQHNGNVFISSFVSAAGELILNVQLGTAVDGVSDPNATWNLNVTTGVAPPFTGPASAPKMDVNSIDNSTKADTLTIQFGAQNLGPTGATSFSAKIGGTADGSLLAQDFYDAANGLFTPGGATTGSVVATLGPFGPGAFSGSVASSAIGGTAYTATKVVTITHPGAGMTSFDFENTVPEPSALVLLASGLAGFGYLRRRVFKR